MAKSKTPFFSIGSRGTVGGSLTTQKRGSATLLRSKPVPTDPYSLAQAYQRWDYKDYAYLWTLLSNSEKQVYRTAASRYHITGFSLWMRENLRDLPNIAGRWRLDEKSGAIAHDSSKNANHATIFGASPAPGRIDGAYNFDGLNDYIDCGNNPSLQITAPFSIETWFLQTTLCSTRVGHEGLVSKYNPATNQGFRLFLRTGNTLELTVWDGAAFSEPVAPFTFIDELVHIIGTHDGTRGRLFLKGLLVATGGINAGLSDAPLNLVIGRQGGYWTTGLLDNVILYPRCLDPTEILRKSQRRYP